eukprot:scaffold17558_cov139-Skeletonema_marinoi.AAC.1
MSDGNRHVADDVEPNYRGAILHREHTSSSDDGHHHVADGVEPNSKGNTMFCSDRCVSFNAPLISDEGSRAYRCITSGGWRDRHK